MPNVTNNAMNLVDVVAPEVIRQTRRFTRRFIPVHNTIQETNKMAKNKYMEATYWKYRQTKERRASRDRKYSTLDYDNSVLTIHSTDFVNAYTKDITPIVSELKPRTYADIVKSNWF